MMTRNKVASASIADGVKSGMRGINRDRRVPVTQLRWRTSSMGDDADTLPMELSELASHLARCDADRGAMASLTGACQAINRFLAPRFVTTLLAIVPLIVVAYLVS